MPEMQLRTDDLHRNLPVDEAATRCFMNIQHRIIPARRNLLAGVQGIPARNPAHRYQATVIGSRHAHPGRCRMQIRSQARSPQQRLTVGAGNLRAGCRQSCCARLIQYP